MSPFRAHSVVVSQVTSGRRPASVTISPPMMNPRFRRRAPRLRRWNLAAGIHTPSTASAVAVALATVDTQDRRAAARSRSILAHFRLSASRAFSWATASGSGPAPVYFLTTRPFTRSAS